MGVGVEIEGAPDVHARRADVHRAPSVVGEVADRVVVVGGRDRDHVGTVGPRRVEGQEVVVVAHECGVSGRSDEQDVALGSDGVGHGLREGAWPAITVVGGDDVDAARLQVARIVEAGHRIGDGAVAGCVEHLAGQELDVPVHAHHAQRVVADRADGPGDVRAVPEVVGRVATQTRERPAASGEDVEAVHIVDVAVAVVIDSVARNLARVDPDVGGQILVRRFDAAVDHHDHHGGASGCEIPGQRRLDVHPGCTQGLAAVVHAPEQVERRLVGRQHGLQDIVGLGVRDVGVGTVAGDGLLDRLVGRNPDQVDAAVLQFAHLDVAFIRMLGVPRGR